MTVSLEVRNEILDFGQWPYPFYLSMNSDLIPVTFVLSGMQLKQMYLLT